MQFSKMETSQLGAKWILLYWKLGWAERIFWVRLFNIGSHSSHRISSAGLSLSEATKISRSVSLVIIFSEWPPRFFCLYVWEDLSNVCTDFKDLYKLRIFSAWVISLSIHAKVFSCSTSTSFLPREFVVHLRKTGMFTELLGTTVVRLVLRICLFAGHSK